MQTKITAYAAQQSNGLLGVTPGHQHLGLQERWPGMLSLAGADTPM